MKTYSGKMSRMKIVLNPGKLTMQQLKAREKCDIIVTGHWWRTDPIEAIGQYKVDGKVLSREDYIAYGYAWNDGELPQMVLSTQLDWYDNFLCTMPLIANGTKLDLYPDTWVAHRTSRPVIGFGEDGTFHLVMFDNHSPWEVREYMYTLGCDSAMMLDGGGSTKAITPDWTWDSSRVLQNYICIWLDKPAGQPEPDEHTIQDAALEFAYALTPRSNTTMLLLHHAASDGSVEAMHNYHRHTCGWAGIAYHYYVRKDGSIWSGRPEDTVGGHTNGYNSVSIGICAEGDYTKETMPKAQQAALTWLVADVLKRWPGLQVYRHSDLSNTECPGRNYPFAGITGTEVSESDTLADKVSDFQRWLNVCCSGGLMVDGIYGVRTKAAAVRAYQRIVGVKADGIFGPKTKAAVKLLLMTSTGDAVRVLQGMLYCHGFDPGTFDGVFGKDTKAAVLAFQRTKGLAADGIAGGNTFEKLMK